MNQKINYNKILVPQINHHYKMNTRAKLDTGTQCNYKCSFCYYIDKLDETKSYEDIIKDVDILIGSGITELDLSGGESSIHKDWFKILDYIHNKNIHISTLSNGSHFRYESFMRKSYQAGLREILFSLHGWDSKSHDRKVGHKGAFNSLMNAISNAQNVGMVVRINCTVQNDFDGLKYSKLINQIKPIQVNLLPLNYWEASKKLKSIDYTKIGNSMKTFTDNITFIMDINVRYMPFCYYTGYEKYIVGTYQHIYDLNDWNLETYDIDKVPKSISIEGAFERAQKNREQSYMKPRECLDCKFRFVCDGIEHSAITANPANSQYGELEQVICKK